MFFFGGAAAMVYGKNDISLVMQLQGLLVPAVVVLLLNIWTTNDNALYTSGLGLSNITGLPKRFLVLFNGILGTLAALWLYNHFCGWLNILNTFIPPCGAILITDYFLLRRCSYPEMAKKRFELVAWPAVVAWALGSVVALAGFNKFGLGDMAPFLMKGIPAINGMVVTAVAYMVFSKLRPAD
jgi:cytosine permease